MILQKTISPCLGNWADVLPPQVHKIGKVSFLRKYILTIITAVVDVIKISVNEWRNVSWHGFNYTDEISDLTGLIKALIGHNIRVDINEGWEKIAEDLSGLAKTNTYGANGVNFETPSRVPV